MEDKLSFLIKMIKFNQDFYQNRCPIYEIDHLEKLGYDRQKVISTIQENGFEIVEYLKSPDIKKENL